MAITLTAAGVAAVTLQRRALVAAIDESLIARAGDVIAIIDSGEIPEQLTFGGGDDAFIQVIDEQGFVVAAGGDLENASAASEDRPQPGAMTTRTYVLPNDDEPVRLIGVSTISEQQTFTVLAGATLEQVEEATRSLAVLLAVGVPLLIGSVAITIWFVIGRALRPIEAIRAEVASITDLELDRRVPLTDVDDEVGRLAETMNQMLSRLEQSSIRQRRFVADASHELRSPLAVIRAQLEVDIAYPEIADWSRTNAVVLDEALRMQRLVDGLLLLAQADAATSATPHEVVDIDDFVFDRVAQIQARTPVTIDTTRVSGAQVRADPGGLDQAIRNLLENGVRYAERRVEIGLTESHGVVTLVIEDDGPGIPAGERVNVFERFTRLDEARDRAHGGVGLGLAITKEIVRQGGGTIYVEDSSLGGARFVIELPVEPAV